MAENNSLVMWLLGAAGSVIGVLALYTLTGMRRDIESLEDDVKNITEDINEIRVDVNGAIDEPRVRDILKEELSDIKTVTASLDEKLTTLILQSKQTPQESAMEQLLKQNNHLLHELTMEKQRGEHGAKTST